MRIEILDAAAADIERGVVFYERQRAGLGRHFLEELFGDIDLLRQYAGIHPVYFGYNRMLAKRFPYAVYYRFDDVSVRIHAVLDCRSDPTWAKNRLMKGA